MPEQLGKFRLKDHEVSFTEPKPDPCFEGHLQNLEPYLPLQGTKIIDGTLVVLINILKFNLQKSKALVERIHRTVQYVADIERLKSFREDLGVENLKGFGAVVSLSPYFICLEKLSFHGFKMGNFPLQVLCLILPRFFNLKILNITNGEIDNHDGEEFINSLAEKTPLLELTTLDLSENFIDDEKAEEIIKKIEAKTQQGKLPKFELICL